MRSTCLSRPFPGQFGGALASIIGFALFEEVLFRVMLLTALVVLLVLRLGSLWLVIGIHAGWNFAMGNIYGIAVSVLPAHTTSRVHLAPTDGAPDWLSGVEVGTEASLAADITLLVAAAIAFVAYRTWSKRRLIHAIAIATGS